MTHSKTLSALLGALVLGTVTILAPAAVATTPCQGYANGPVQSLAEAGPDFAVAGVVGSAVVSGVPADQFYSVTLLSGATLNLAIHNEAGSVQARYQTMANVEPQPGVVIPNPTDCDGWGDWQTSTLSITAPSDGNTHTFFIDVNYLSGATANPSIAAFVLTNVV